LQDASARDAFARPAEGRTAGLGIGIGDAGRVGGGGAAAGEADDEGEKGEGLNGCDPEKVLPAILAASSSC
jgi:hypothetical protein